MISPFLGRLFLVSKRTLIFWGVIRWMLHIGRARHPGPGPRDFPPGQLSVEFLNVGGWLTSGDLALDSCAQFLAIAEFRLIPSRAGSVCHQLRRAGVALDVTCRFSREDGAVSQRDFFVGCPSALAASEACYVTDRWFTPHFSVIARFRIGAWMADVACAIACQPIWPARWLDIHDRSSSSSSRSVQGVWDVYREELGVVPDDVVLALRDAASRFAVDDFWSFLEY